MKKNIFIAALLILSIKLSAQAYSNSDLQANITDSNAFLDASSNFNSSANGSQSLGKGLVFPDTDLTQFEFDMTLADGIYFPSYFDGMVVYNTGNGNTRTGGSNPTVASTVTAGFYYFSNPDGATNENVSAGTWKPLGGGNTKVTVPEAAATPAGVATNVIVAGGKEVYAVRGQFTTTLNSTSVKIAVPTDLTSLYRITIYKDGAVFGTNVYSYDKANTTTNNAYTGAPGMSVVYPVGTYDYVLEYLK